MIEPLFATALEVMNTCALVAERKGLPTTITPREVELEKIQQDAKAIREGKRQA